MPREHGHAERAWSCGGSLVMRREHDHADGAWSCGGSMVNGHGEGAWSCGGSMVMQRERGHAEGVKSFSRLIVFVTNAYLSLYNNPSVNRAGSPWRVVLAS